MYFVVFFFIFPRYDLCEWDIIADLSENNIIKYNFIIIDLILIWKMDNYWFKHQSRLLWNCSQAKPYLIFKIREQVKFIYCHLLQDLMDNYWFILFLWSCSQAKPYLIFKIREQVEFTYFYVLFISDGKIKLKCTSLKFWRSDIFKSSKFNTINFQKMFKNVFC